MMREFRHSATIPVRGPVSLCVPMSATFSQGMTSVLVHWARARWVVRAGADGTDPNEVDAALGDICPAPCWLCNGSAMSLQVRALIQQAADAFAARAAEEYRAEKESAPCS